MDVTTYQTHVALLPALNTRNGLTPAQWSVTHLCNRCLDYVPAEQLIAHTQIHAAELSGCEDFHSRQPSGTMARSNSIDAKTRSRPPKIHTHR